MECFDHFSKVKNSVLGKGDFKIHVHATGWSNFVPPSMHYFRCMPSDVVIRQRVQHASLYTARFSAFELGVIWKLHILSGCFWAAAFLQQMLVHRKGGFRLCFGPVTFDFGRESIVPGGGLLNLRRKMAQLDFYSRFSNRESFWDITTSRTIRSLVILSDILEKMQPSKIIFYIA